MQSDTFLFVRIVFTGLFLVTLFSGFYLFKNFQRLFGQDADMPSEGASSRAYSRVQVFTVWAHAVVLTGAFALLLH
jgi:hypothetical protein